MTVRKILRMGDPLLLQRAAEVKAFGTPALKSLLADMFDTMHAAGGVGLAAPQIGVSLQLVVIEDPAEFHQGFTPVDLCGGAAPAT